MVHRIARFAPPLILIASVLAYGGFAYTPWIQLFIGLTGILFVISRHGKTSFPIPKKFLPPLLLLLTGLALQLSISPDRWATLEGLAWVLCALIVASLFTVPETERISDRLFVWIVTAIGLFQIVLIPRDLLSNSGKAGTFFNPNHTGAFLCIAFWLAWRCGRVLLFGTTERGHQIRTFILTLILAGIVLTFSAGAYLALSLALFLFFIRRWISPIKSVPVTLILLVGIQTFYAFSRTSNGTEFSTSSIPVKFHDADRRAMVRAAVYLFHERPLLGHGLGAYPERFLSLTDIDTTYRIANFAHHDIFQGLSELGLPLFCVCLFLSWTLLSFLNRPFHLENMGRHRLRQAVLWAGITLLFHSLVDFPWHAPGIFLCFIALAAASLPTRQPPSRASALALSVFSVLVLGFATLSGYTGYAIRHQNLLPTAARFSWGNPEVSILWAKQLIRERKLNEAFSAAAVAVTRAPYRADARELYGALLTEKGELGEAARQMGRAAELDHGNGKRLMRIGHWLVSHGFTKEAVELAASMRYLNAPWPQECLAILGRIAMDPILLRRCLDLSEPSRRLDLAMFLESNGQKESAFEEAYSILPNGLTHDLVPWFVQLTVKAQKMDEAADRLRPLTQGHAGTADLERLKARILFTKKEYLPAAEALNQAAQKGGGPSDYWNDMADLLPYLESDQCVIVAQRWLKQWPRSTYSHLADAQCAEKNAYYASALAAISKALQLSPGNEDALQARIRLWQKREMNERAVDAACEARAAKVSNTSFFDMCVRGLAKGNRCDELRKVWNDHMGHIPDPAAWTGIAESLRNDPAVAQCLGRL